MIDIEELRKRLQFAPIVVDGYPAPMTVKEMRELIDRLEIAEGNHDH